MKLTEDFCRDFNKVNEIFCFSPYGPAKKEMYLHNMEIFFEENSNLCLSTNAEDEFNKILENSKDLLKNDCALGLTKLYAYLMQQENILFSSRSKFSRDVYTYEKLFTFVAKVALFDIDQAFLLREPLSRYHQDMNKYATDLEINSWNAIKIIEKFKLLEGFKNEIFLPKKELIRKACLDKGIYVNRLESSGRDSSGGCFFVFIGLFVISLLASF